MIEHTSESTIYYILISIVLAMNSGLDCEHNTQMEAGTRANFYFHTHALSVIHVLLSLLKLQSANSYRYHVD